MRVDLELNKEIYQREYIEQSINDYSNLANIRCTEDDSYFLLSFRLCKFGKERTISEFCNYLIDLQNSKE